MEELKKTVAKLKNNKLILVILIIGIVLLTVPLSGTDKEEKEKKTDYEATLTEKTEEVLALISGAGKVKVMLTLDNDGTTYPSPKRARAEKKPFRRRARSPFRKRNTPRSGVLWLLHRERIFPACARTS